ncbi:MAG: sulfotransferase [Candidatus Binatus sp.]|uniref:sulfotransferase family protein n=1 Tax=Candidatus Binatus sp. TaxID=2811406 RepID=UPI002722E09F|nr:sulfotransferase family protein [Candidatus Binatus sp.]MDO8433276.1 sulfotransferase [Candidatus Binatus sp.]
MALKVVGAGFGRTGTLSLKKALEIIGFGPCYHMMEVFPRPEHVAMWHRLAFGQSMDWDLVFRDFQATVDWPAARWWREMAAHYPAAKVLLSVRDPKAWYKSMSDTIYQPMKWPVPDNMPEQMRLQNEMVRKAILADTFDNRFEDKTHAIEVFQRHNQEVRDTIDPARLLVFDVREGWAPLCRFLEVAVPEEPFPRLNDTASTQALIQRMRESMRQV